MRNRPEFPVETEIRVSFADIGGADEAKEKLGEVVAFLRDPALGGRLGARKPKAMLLIGPSGTGKTLLARAAAGEAKLPLFAVNSSDLVERSIAGGACPIADLFEQAIDRAPAILFIDDIEQLACAGEAHPASRGRLLGRLLVELDRLDSAAGVTVLAATNRREALDRALLRAGRFEPVPVPRPDLVARAQILQLHTRALRMSSELDLVTVAASTRGLTGADLARLVNQAALLGTRRGADAVAASDFSSAAERIRAGLGAPTVVLTVHEREVSAYHEVGHALLALTLPGGEAGNSFPLTPPRAATADCSMGRPPEDRVLWAHQELENELAVLLGGRAAEHIVFGEFSSLGAADLRRATAIARDIAVRYGMTAELGQVSYDLTSRADSRAHGQGYRNRHSEATARAIDRAVKSIIESAFSRAVELLKAQRRVLEQGAQLLVRNGILDAAEFVALRRRYWSCAGGDDVEQ